MSAVDGPTTMPSMVKDNAGCSQSQGSESTAVVEADKLGEESPEPKESDKLLQTTTSSPGLQPVQASAAEAATTGDSGPLTETLPLSDSVGVSPAPDSLDVESGCKKKK